MTSTPDATARSAGPEEEDGATIGDGEGKARGASSRSGARRMSARLRMGRRMREDRKGKKEREGEDASGCVLKQSGCSFPALKNLIEVTAGEDPHSLP
ncbi:hypothetical protein R5R35_002404 [Gryllus longicercus]|uniref:Uncharacterized protein n=1 Tax=Gryllus longicercus TaxID=2509291 RepID=A0AAN9VWG4_9ORTH